MGASASPHEGKLLAEPGILRARDALAMCDLPQGPCAVRSGSCVSCAVVLGQMGYSDSVFVKKKKTRKSKQ